MGHLYLRPVWAHKKAQSLSNMDGFLLLRKMSSFFPSSVRPVRGKFNSSYLNSVNSCRYPGIQSVNTYSVDAAASGGLCSTGNNSQTPSRRSSALTRG